MEQSDYAVRITRTGNRRDSTLMGGSAYLSTFTVHHAPFTIYQKVSLARARGFNCPCQENTQGDP